MRWIGEMCQARELRVLCLGMWMKGRGVSEAREQAQRGCEDMLCSVQDF